MITLIHPDGSLDQDAIAAEIIRRCADQLNRGSWANHDYHTRHVLNEAAAAQWPFVEARIAAEWRPSEREQYLDLLSKASVQSPDGVGNRRAEELSYQARAMAEAVRDRAIKAFHERIGQ